MQAKTCAKHVLLASSKSLRIRNNAKVARQASFKSRAKKLSATAVAWVHSGMQEYQYRIALTVEDAISGSIRIEQVKIGVFIAAHVGQARLQVVATTERMQARVLNAV